VKRKRRNAPIRSIHVNFKALAVLVALLGAGTLVVYLVKVGQERRMSREALETARRLRDAGEVDLAVRHLNQHLAIQPADVNALGLKGEILAGSAQSPGQIMEAARVHEQFLRASPNDPGSQDVRRRLVNLYVRYGDLLKVLAVTQVASELITLESRYRAAESFARQLIDRGANDPGAHRLLAESLDGLAVPGDPAAIDAAVQMYRKVLEMDPADVVAAERLARLYLGRLKDPIRAERVFDDLLRVRPGSVDVRLARHRFYVQLRGNETYGKIRGNPAPKATAELEEAIKLAPDDVAVIVSAAEDALRRGDTDGARRQIDRVPEASRGDIRVLMTRGMIDYSDENPDEAVDIWRRGLSASYGTNEQMTWWLAYTLIQMGRVSEARPLMGQYRRLSGQDTPMLLMLQAQLDERTGRPARAVSLLTQISARLGEQWTSLIQLARGRCYEALWDELKAMEAYNLALQADPTSVVPRLAIAKLKVKHRPDDAVEEVRRGLALLPGDPALRIALAGALMRKEAALPASRRSWGEFEAAWNDAAKTSNKSAVIALMWADRLALSGQDAAALRYLEDAITRGPKNPAVAVALADGLMRLGNPTRALEVIDRALAPGAAGDQASLRIARARALTLLNRGRDARAALIQDIEKLSPADRPQVWIALGQLEVDHGNSDAARQAYTEWAQLQPEDSRPRLVLLELALNEENETAVRALVEDLRRIGGTDDVAYRLGRAKQLLWERDAARPPEGSRDRSLEEAGKLVDGVLSDAPELPAAQMMHAQVLERQGRTAEAIASYERSWERGVEAALPKLIELLSRTKRYDSLNRLRASASRNTQLDLLSAQAFLRVGDRTQARNIADQVARDLPASVEVASWQARMLNHLGQIDDAETVLRAMAERQPGVLEPWLSLISSQASHKKTRAVAQTIARVKAEVKFDPPALVEARCLWAAGDIPGADKAFADALAAKPSDVIVRTQAAKFYEQIGRLLEAEKCLTGVLKIDPNNRAASRQLAVVISGRSTTDITLWNKAWETLCPEGTDGGDPEDRLARAAVLARCPDPARRDLAVERLEGLTDDLPARNPIAAAARDLLARLHLAAGRPEKASRVAAVSATGATSPDAIALYAQTLIQSRKPEAAAWQLDRLAALSPGDQREARLRARLAWDGTRPVESATALERVYTVRENTPGAEAIGREAFLLLAASGSGSNSAAQRLGQKLAAQRPAFAWMPAKILVRASRYDEALALLMTAAQTDASLEDLSETCRTAMEVAVATDDPVTLRKVDAVITTAIRAEPNADELAILLAMLRHTQLKFDEEIQLYKSVLAHKPEDYLVLNNLAWALAAGQKRPDEGLKYIDELLRITGRDAQVLDTRGVILARLGRFDEAIKDLEEVIKAEPNALHYFHLALTYKLAGRLEDARRCRDLARKSGITLRDLDPAERNELASVMELQ
jgi:tetratricopeptide (TPR) repeat protein